MDAEPATSLRRGIELLLALAADDEDAEEGRGVVRLAEIVDSDKSRVSRTLKTLAEYELVERDPTTLSYRLGWQFFALAARAGDGRMRTLGAAYVRRLSRHFGEGAHMTILTRTGKETVTVLSEAPPVALQSARSIGARVPSHCTSSGRALLMDHSEAELRAIFGGDPLPPGGPNAPRTVDELIERVTTAAEQGCAVIDEELEQGLVGASAPVRDFTGHIVAALNLSGPKFRLQPRLYEAALEIRDAAADLSRALGWTPPRPGTGAAVAPRGV